MANHASAEKAIRQAKKKTLINKNRVSRIRTYLKKVNIAVDSGSSEDAAKALIVAQSEIMQGVAKNLIKLNTASRRISRLAKKIKNMKSA